MIIKVRTSLTDNVREPVSIQLH